MLSFWWTHGVIWNREVGGATPQTQNETSFKLQKYLVKHANHNSGFGSVRSSPTASECPLGTVYSWVQGPTGIYKDGLVRAFWELVAQQKKDHHLTAYKSAELGEARSQTAETHSQSCVVSMLAGSPSQHPSLPALCLTPSLMRRISGAMDSRTPPMSGTPGAGPKAGVFFTWFLWHLPGW